MARTDRVGSHKTDIGVDAQGHMYVRYHQTDVVTWNDRLVMLNHGGHMTPTTKLRMNQAANQYGLGYYVFQKRGAWYVRDRAGNTKEFDGGYAVVQREP